MIKIKITKKTFKDYFSVAWRELAVVAAVLFVDLLSKHLIDKNMSEGQTIVVIPKFLNFSYAKNKEAAMGFDFFGLSEKLGEAGMRLFFIIFISISISGFMVFLISSYKNRFFYRLPWALIIGGAVGNLYDRIFHKAVRDFIQIEYFGKTIRIGSYEASAFFTFNLADSALVIGVIVFFVYFIFFYFKDEKKKEEAKKALEAAEANQTEIDCLIPKTEGVDGIADTAATQQTEAEDAMASKNIKEAAFIDDKNQG